MKNSLGNLMGHKNIQLISQIACKRRDKKIVVFHLGHVALLKNTLSRLRKFLVSFYNLCVEVTIEVPGTSNPLHARQSSNSLEINHV